MLKLLRFGSSAFTAISAVSLCLGLAGWSRTADAGPEPYDPDCVQCGDDCEPDIFLSTCTDSTGDPEEADCYCQNYSCGCTRRVIRGQLYCFCKVPV